jgi:hypothetical protein
MGVLASAQSRDAIANGIKTEEGARHVYMQDQIGCAVKEKINNGAHKALERIGAHK